jgi:hypothetical protein
MKKGQVRTMKISKNFQALTRSKKSQVRIMETIAILLIFFVLVVMGFVFFMRTVSVTQEGKVTKDQELQSIRVSQSASFLPELQCSSKNIIDENCFDKYKLDAFTNDNFYYPFFYFSSLSVSEIYPGNQSWVLYNNSLNGTSYKTTIPILLRNVTARTDSFGLLVVEYFPLG